MISPAPKFLLAIAATTVLLFCSATSLAQNAQTTEQTNNIEELKKLVESLEEKIQQQSKEIAQLKRNQKRLRSEVNRLQAEQERHLEFGQPRSLFDGSTLKGWEVSSYGGEGEVAIVDGTIHMSEGDPISGINVLDEVELPRNNYEVSFKAMKIEGTDFFGSVTFPVNDSYCSLIVGGWGGTLIGLSNLDDKDASENGTRVLKKFEKNQWYRIRVRVLPERITAWIDDERMVDETIKDRKVSVRNDVIPSQPLGITSFITTCAIKDVELRTLVSDKK